MTRYALLSCLVLAGAVTLPFQPWAGARKGPCALEVALTSDEPGLASLSYDAGRGYNAEDSEARAVRAGGASVVRFALRGGSLRSLELSPLDRDARLTLGAARIIDGSGRTLAAFEPGQFRASGGIESSVAGSTLAVRTLPGAANALLRLDLARPLALPGPSVWKPIALVFAALLAALASFDLARRSMGVRRFLDSVLPATARAHPGLSILSAALAATLLANYPVVFAGRSLVSPNLGTALLYRINPWVPGFQSTEQGNSDSADVDALMWAHLPYSMVQHGAVFRDGELPLWNRYNSTGTPLLGQGQSCLGDPLQLIPILANGAAWAWDLKLLAAKALLSAGIGLCVWRLARRLGASMLMAASSQFIGFFVFRVNHPAIFSMGYAPWILYSWMSLAEARTGRSAVLWLAALLAANLCELASGTVKEAYVLLGWMNLSGALVLLAGDIPAPRRMRLLAGAAAESALFAMIGSPLWYSLYAELGRAATLYDTPAAFQLQPGMFIGLFDELFYRPFQAFYNVVNPSANFLVLAGVLWAAVRWRAVAADRAALALALASVPLLLLVFGVVPPSVINAVPYLRNIMHVDNTFSCPLIILFLVLAGAGWRQAWERLGTPAGIREAAAVLLLMAVAVAAYLGTAQTVARGAYAPLTWGSVIRLGTFVRAYGASLLAASALLMATIHLARRRGGWTPALAACAALALAALHWRHGLQVGTSFPEAVIMPTRRVDLQAPSPAVEAALGRATQPFRAVGFDDNLLPGWSGVYGLEGICGPDALMNRYYRGLMEASGLERLWDWRYRVKDADLPAVGPILDALNVRFYLDYPAGHRGTKKGLEDTGSSDMELYESPTCWPRAFFTDSVALYDSVPQFCSWIKAGDRRPFAAMERGEWNGLRPLPRVSGDLRNRTVRAAQGYHLTGNSTSFTVTATGPGFIVLTEAYEPRDLRATLDGAEVPCLRINHAFRGIYVDAAGTYSVAFSYWPRGLSASLAAAAAGLALALAACVAAVLGLGPLAAGSAAGRARAPARP